VTDAALVADPADVEKNKVMAILAYIIFLVPLLAAKDSPFARYHTNQGLVLFLVIIASFIALGILNVILGFILPAIGCCVGSVLSLAFVGGALTLAIMGILNVVKGQMKPLPLIGGIKIIK